MKAEEVHSIKDLVKHIKNAIYRGADEFGIPKPKFVSPSEVTISNSYGNGRSHTRYVANGSRIEVYEMPLGLGDNHITSRGSFPCTIIDLSRVVALADKKAKARLLEEDLDLWQAEQDTAKDFGYFMSLHGSQLQGYTDVEQRREFRDWQRGPSV